MSSVSETFALTGRLHPLLVHLPIGMLVMLVFLEVLAAFPRFRQANKSVGYVLAVTVPAAIFSAVLGYLLSLGGGYEPKLLSLHLWTGVATAAAVLVMAVFFWTGWIKCYRALLCVSFLSLVVASHYGGSLTHGADYLAGLWPSPRKSVTASREPKPVEGAAVKPAQDASEMPVFAGLVQPVLKQNCVGCHGPQKSKADLRLDSFDGLMKGGESGPVLAEGDSQASLLLKRMLLPLEDENHMPPEGKPQPKEADLALIKWWIDSGASATAKVANLKVTPSVSKILAARFGGSSAPAPQLSSPKPLAQILPDAQSLSADLGIAIAPLSEKEPWLQCNASVAGSQFDDASLVKLSSVGTNIQWLDLSRTAVSDEGLKSLAHMPFLTRLHLERTGVSDTGVSNLAALTRLEYLNLYGTAVSDEGLEHLQDLPKLKRLYLWETKVTPTAAARFADLRSDLDQVKKWEQEIERLKGQISSAKMMVDLGTTRPAAGSTNAVAEAKAPANQQCPVSGKPIDPSKTVLHEGKVVAFCCDDCKAKFQKDPQPFLAKLGLAASANAASTGTK